MWAWAAAGFEPPIRKSRSPQGARVARWALVGIPHRFYIVYREHIVKRRKEVHHRDMDHF